MAMAVDTMSFVCIKLKEKAEDNAWTTTINPLLPDDEKTDKRG